MRIFDDEERIKRIFKEFKKVDEFYGAFKKEFETNIVLKIIDFHPDFKRTESFDELLDQFSVAALSITHSVLDKDSSYPDYRKAEDLQALQAYYTKARSLAKNKELADVLHQKTKELLVKYYPKIVDLSGDGFRLLELNLKLFNLEFVASFNNLE